MYYFETLFYNIFNFFERRNRIVVPEIVEVVQTEAVVIDNSPKVPGTSLTEKEFNTLEKELEESLADKFSKVWLQASRLSSVCITAFPNDGSTYRIFTQKNVKNFNVDNLKNIVISKM